MFKTIKSKIVFVAVCIFALFNFAVILIEINGYENYKKLKIEAYRHRTENFADIINITTSQIENNVRTLALYGASLHLYPKDKNFLNFVVNDNFLNNDYGAIGGGIWFEPQAINPQKFRYCAYASQVNNNVVIDTKCDSEEYNYLNQHWYKAVKNKFSVKTKNDVVWSTPYFDEIGTKKLMITAGAPIYDKNNKFIGIATVDWLLENISEKLKNARPTPNSIVTFADKKSDYVIAVSGNNISSSNYSGQSMSKLPWLSQSLSDGVIHKFQNQNYISFVSEFDNGMTVIVDVPEKEIFELERQHIIINLIVRILSILVFVLIIYSILLRNVNKPVEILLKAAKRIGQGDFQTKITIKKPQEFAQLAQTFNRMTTDIAEHLENIKNLMREKHLIEMDLSVAKEIQASSLPCIFPPFPDIVAIDIFATMHAAKQVGGDFYDFYFLDNSHIAFTIADVSGKGVPAALFMMRAKSILKSTTLANPVFENIMSKVNDTICDNNEKGFFMTCALGIIDIKTGNVTYINAGHNPPVLKRNNTAQYLEIPTNLAVGIIENIQFEVSNIKLNPLESLILYTDGVTEANDKDKNLYGEERLLQTIAPQSHSPKEIIESINEDVLSFTAGEEQADDITMLCLTYLGAENFIKKINVPAEVSGLKDFIAWIEQNCKECNLGEKEKTKLLICAEEIFVNIAYYAYPGTLKERIQETSIIFKYIKPLKEVSLTFMDSGIPYNPLEKPDPDVNLPIEERTAGGLGIFMVKNLVDSIQYEYKNRQNVLVIKCRIQD